jgi:diguanylate cyclase (GGDEF)-like protein
MHSHSSSKEIKRISTRVIVWIGIILALSSLIALDIVSSGSRGFIYIILLLSSVFGLGITLTNRDKLEKTDGSMIGKSYSHKEMTEIVEMRLEHFINHDSLTHLPNRSLFIDRLSHALGRAKRENGQVAVMVLDLDGFGAINNAFGHNEGDSLLQVISQRFTDCIRTTDTIARMDGDEYSVLLEGISRPQDVALIASKILKAANAPILIQGNEIYISASIGISLSLSDGKTPQQLLQNADAALKRSKSQGGNNFQFFSVEMKAAAIDQLSLTSQMHHALERNEFFLNYQPQVNMDTGSIDAVEALLRWKHPVKGVISPSKFIPLAEESGLIIPIGEWVLREACTQGRKWELSGLPSIRVAVNISGKQLKQNNLADLISNILHETQLDPQLLELELTENIIFENLEETSAQLIELKELGVRLAIDDFGAGYSTLRQLAYFPFDVLKIDQEFATNSSRHVNDEKVIAGIIMIGTNLGMEVVAEGVETDEQLAMFETQGCNQAQGWYFSKAVSAEDIGTLLQSQLHQN